VSAFHTIGILGGGQLGRMLTLEARRMGFRVVTLEPLPNSPCGQVADEQIVAAYDDVRAIGELGARADVTTYEFENIPLVSVTTLEAQHRIVRPDSAVLRITQDRALEKEFVRALGVATAAFVAVPAGGDLAAALERIGYPAVVKTTLGGYDGKGQWIVRTPEDARAAAKEAGARGLIAERFVAFECEVSIICTRGSDGGFVTFPISENVHDHGVLALSIVPARIPPAVLERVREIARAIGEGLGIVGTFCVEFFVEGNDVLVNEIAPRVHNSGHYSLDATSISQYEAHVRAICDLPLVEPELRSPAVMVNILGDGGGDHLAGVPALLSDPHVKLHLYGKAHAALRRKMGHFTVLAPTLPGALAEADRGRALLHWTRLSA
jgi:5-(carboxyamino)imidazole ribonucleotide synthase